MTWTCTYCNSVLVDVEVTTCPCCRKGKPEPSPAGLSEEERAALDADAIAREAAGWGKPLWHDGGDFSQWREERIHALTFWKAARAPLEAEVTDLSKKLEFNRTAAKESHDRANRLMDERQRLEAEVKTLRVSLAVAESLAKNAKESYEALSRAYNKLAKWYTDLRAQLSQAQKPAASPPGVVSAPAMDALGTFQVPGTPIGNRAFWRHSAYEAAKADIRANVERETKRDKARIAELERENEWLKATHRCSSSTLDMVSDDIREEIRMRRDKEAALNHFASENIRIIGERDAALAEVERLRGERFPSATRANLEALCRYLNDTCSKEPEFYPSADVAGVALVLLIKARAEVERLKGERAELLAALKAVIDDFHFVDKEAHEAFHMSLGGDDPGYGGRVTINEARALIAKIEGGTAG